MLKQRYVSTELTHFVGARLATAEEQYSLLATILRSGVLKVPGQSDVVATLGPDGTRRTTVTRSMTVVHGKRLSSNAKYSPSIVCFADIPVDDLGLHIFKYSSFGLSFLKDFLVRCGATPVLYVAAQSSTNVRNPLANDGMNHGLLQQLALEWKNGGHRENFTRAEVFDAAEQELSALLPFAPEGRAGAAPAPTAPGSILREFLFSELFPFIKFFNPDLDEGDPENYYMEREWRVVGPVKFELENVERLLVPRALRTRLYQDFPDFRGQISFPP
jgi:hypothetical protein